jgi:hypothetical protein
MGNGRNQRFDSHGGRTNPKFDSREGGGEKKKVTVSATDSGENADGICLRKTKGGIIFAASLAEDG